VVVERDCDFLADARSKPTNGGVTFCGIRSIIVSVENHWDSFERMSWRTKFNRSWQGYLGCCLVCDKAVRLEKQILQVTASVSRFMIKLGISLYMTSSECACKK
jgi:hypothetical protein